MNRISSRRRYTLLACAACAAAMVTFAACSDDGGSRATPVPPTVAAAGSQSAARSPAPVSPGASAPTAGASSLTITSDAFDEGGVIPIVYSCSGDGVSPPLAWSGAPQGTQSFALLVDDPDAPGGNFDHWVVYDLPASARTLPTGIPEGIDIAGGGKQGVNGVGTNKYLGPCPPAGAPHHYQFRLFALDTQLDVDPGSNKKAVEAALQTHILGRAELVGLFSR